jgi:hypothetical protein
MSAVWMRHPELPDDQLIEVDPLQVPHHAAAGWVKTDAPTPRRSPFTKEPDESKAPQASRDAAAPPTVGESETSPQASRDAAEPLTAAGTEAPPETEPDAASTKRRRASAPKESQ